MSKLVWTTQGKTVYERVICFDCHLSSVHDLGWSSKKSKASFHHLSRWLFTLLCWYNKFGQDGCTCCFNYGSDSLVGDHFSANWCPSLARLVKLFISHLLSDDSRCVQSYISKMTLYDMTIYITDDSIYHRYTLSQKCSIYYRWHNLLWGSVINHSAHQQCMADDSIYVQS